MKMNIKKGDSVVVLSGKNKGKKGKVLETYPKKDTVIVEGVMVATKHKKPRKQGDVGGIIHQETPVAACKLMVICNKCQNPTRAAHRVINNKSERICKKCGETI